MRKLAAFLGTGILGTSALLISAHSRAVAQSTPPTAIVATPVTLITSDFRSGTIDFDKTTGMVAAKTTTVSFQGRQVISAEVMLKGFDVEFVDAEHPVHREMVKFDNIQLDGENVKFDTHLLIRDNSGNIDDAYDGHVDYVVIARTR